MQRLFLYLAVMSLLMACGGDTSDKKENIVAQEEEPRINFFNRPYYDYELVAYDNSNPTHVIAYAYLIDTPRLKSVLHTTLIRLGIDVRALTPEGGSFQALMYSSDKEARNRSLGEITPASPVAVYNQPRDGKGGITINDNVFAVINKYGDYYDFEKVVRKFGSQDRFCKYAREYYNALLGGGVDQEAERKFGGGMTLEKAEWIDLKEAQIIRSLNQKYGIKERIAPHLIGYACELIR